MSKISRYLVAAILSLLLATSFSSILAAQSPQSKPSSTASSQDKAKACNDAADKQNLTGAARKTFTENCLNKAADTGSSANVSEQDKGKTCNDLADKKGLKGADRRSYVKDCMKKANPQ